MKKRTELAIKEIYVGIRQYGNFFGTKMVHIALTNPTTPSKNEIFKIKNVADKVLQQKLGHVVFRDNDPMFQFKAIRNIVPLMPDCLVHLETRGEEPINDSHRLYVSVVPERLDYLQRIGDELIIPISQEISLDSIDEYRRDANFDYYYLMPTNKSAVQTIVRLMNKMYGERYNGRTTFGCWRLCIPYNLASSFDLN